MSFTLAIVGRPNVGKSTLFNRLVGKRLALVDDQPGVTRDLREGEAKLGDLRFTVIDTAGLEDATDDSLQGRMRRLTERAVEMADACLFMIDARAGVTPTDEVFADILRRKGSPVFVAANKAEGMAADAGVMEAYGLGLGDPIRLSAEHGEGLNELYTALMPLADQYEERAKEDAPAIDVTVHEDEDAPDHTPTEKKPLQIAVVGRPNAGKSTLINKILGEDRLLTGPEAGLPVMRSPSRLIGRVPQFVSLTRPVCVKKPKCRINLKSYLYRMDCARLNLLKLSLFCSMRPFRLNNKIFALQTLPNEKGAPSSWLSTNGMLRTISKIS